MDCRDPLDAIAGDVFAPLDPGADAAEDALDVMDMAAAAWDLDMAPGAFRGDALEDEDAWDLHWADGDAGEAAAGVIDDASLDLGAFPAPVASSSSSSSSPSRTPSRTPSSSSSNDNSSVRASSTSLSSKKPGVGKTTANGATPASTKPKVNDRNAEACRRSRLKRKADVENLRRRNAELEARRELFLERIAQLQMEVSTLRHDNCIDLDKENELLRAEICKHKAFINKIVRVVDDTPAMVLEERVRLLKTGIESSLGQVIGLLHTSTAWRAIDPIVIEEGLEMQFSYQLLPLGASLEKVKRVNVRAQIHNIDVEPEIFADSCWNSVGDIEKLREAENLRASESGIRSDVQRFMPPEMAEAVDLLMDDFELFQLTEMPDESPGTQEPKPERSRRGSTKKKMNRNSAREAGVARPDGLLQAWIASTKANRKMFPRAFVCAGPETEASRDILASLAPGAVDCQVIAFTELSKDLERANIVPARSGSSPFRRPGASVLSGNVIVPTESGTSCHIVSVGSMPMGLFSGMFSSAREIINEDGSFTDAFREDLGVRSQLYWHASILDARRRAEQQRLARTTIGEQPNSS